MGDKIKGGIMGGKKNPTGIKQMYWNAEYTILCDTLSSIKFSRINYDVKYRFMDMIFRQVEKSSRKTKFLLAIDEDMSRIYTFHSKDELCAFLENRTKHLMKKFKEEYDVQQKVGSEVPESGEDDIKVV